jgi:hypothetical protein
MKEFDEKDHEYEAEINKTSPPNKYRDQLDRVDQKVSTFDRISMGEKANEVEEGMKEDITLSKNMEHLSNLRKDF